MSAGSTRADQLRDAVERGFVELGHRHPSRLRRGGPWRRHGVGRDRRATSELRQRDPDRRRRRHRRPGRARRRRPIRVERERRPLRRRPSPRRAVRPRPSPASDVTVTDVVDATENPSGFAVGAESQVILFMFLTSMTGAVALITTRLLRDLATRVLDADRARDDRPRRDARPVRLRPVPGRLHRRSHRRSCSASTGSTRWRPAPSSSCSRSSRRAPPCSSPRSSRNEHQLSALGPALGMILALLGGAMVPIEVFPPIMQTLSHLDARTPGRSTRSTDCCSTVAASTTIAAAARGAARLRGRAAGLATFRFRRQVTGGSA